MDKRYLSGLGLVGCLLVSDHGQSQLEKFAPSGYLNPISTFKFQDGVTPFSDVQWPLFMCIGYIASLGLLTAYMKDRRAWDLYHLRVIHNFILSFGSFLMLAGILQAMWKVFMVGGFDAVLCDEDCVQLQGSLYFWYYAFYLSKYYEFIDTGILIFRKKQVSFLHAFHHVTTVMIAWGGLVSKNSIQWPVIALNTLVHVFMYYYYFIQTFGQEIWWKKHLTTAQIAQFCVDLLCISTWFFQVYVQGRKCSGDGLILAGGSFVIFCFLLLFLNFYARAYKAENGEQRKRRKEE